MLILDIIREAKKTGQKRLRTLKDLDQAALLLARACALLLDDNTDVPDLRQVIFKCVPKNRLAESVSKVNELARPQNNNFHDEMVEQYGRVKRFLPAVLRDLHFRAAPAGEHVLAAIHYLAELNGSKKRILDDAPEHIITGLETPRIRCGGTDTACRLFTMFAGTPSGCTAPPGHLA